MKQSIGIEIGSLAVRAARISIANHTPQLEAFVQEPLPAGAAKDGEIVDLGAVAKAVASACSKVGTSKGKASISISLANQKVVARIAELPYMDESDLRGAIRYQVQELIPIPMDLAVLDYEVLKEFTNDEEERMIRVMVVAAHKDMINTFVDAFEQAGVVPEAIDFTPLALMRSMGAQGRLVPENLGEGEALIDVGEEITSMVVHENEVPKLARVLAIGGNESAEALVDEIRGSVEYYVGQGETAGISKVMISGETPSLKELSPLLSEALQAPVEMGGCFKNIKTSKDSAENNEFETSEPLMAIAVGAALGAMQS
ncbi:MAG: type IV pilus biogenesis protein PilM [Actinomycetota bacterium]